MNQKRSPLNLARRFVRFFVSMKAPNIPLLVISFLTALTLWAIVQAQNIEIKDRTINVPLHFTNLDPSFVVTEADPNVEVRLEGPNDQLSDPGLKSIECTVDLRGAVPGTKTYNALIFTRNASIRRLIPSDHAPVRMTIERLVSREMKVTMQLRGRLLDPTARYDNATISPDMVTFTGSQSRVDSIAKARVSLDLGSVDVNHAGQHQALTVIAFDAANRDVPGVSAVPPTVSVTVSTVPASVEKELFVDPQFFGGPMPGFVVVGYSTQPVKVTVSGSSSALSEITSIKTEAIDLSGLKASTTRSVHLMLPQGVDLQSKRPIQVRIVIARQPIPDTQPKTKPTDPPFPDTVPPITPGKGSGRK